LYFTSKRGVLVTILMLGVAISLWCAVGLSVYQEITGEKSSILSISLTLLVFILTASATWIFASCGYTITDQYLIAHMGPIRRRIKLSQIQVVRWAFISDNGIGLSGDMLDIRLENDWIKVSPKDVRGFLEILRECCPTAEITNNEIPPRLFSNDHPFDKISAKEQELDKKDEPNTLALLILVFFPFLFLGFIVFFGLVIKHK